MDQESAEEVHDIDKENKNDQEKNLDLNNTNENNKTNLKDLKNSRKPKKRFEPQLLNEKKRMIEIKKKKLFSDKHIVKNNIKYKDDFANVPKRVIYVNKVWTPETVTFKYFEPGRSFMKADLVHHLISQKNE
ncbi:hypothetical protein FQR65_LT01028 [Abscondita terminalis]|nr:hypothetical protein FQR65_LT01028 [Abscondita terminalis]